MLDLLGNSRGMKIRLLSEDSRCFQWGVPFSNLLLSKQKKLKLRNYHGKLFCILSHFKYYQILEENKTILIKYRLSLKI